MSRIFCIESNFCLVIGYTFSSYSLFRSLSSASRSTDESHRAAATTWFAPRRKRATASPTTWEKIIWKTKTGKTVFKTKTVTPRQRPVHVVSPRCCVVTRFGSNRMFQIFWNNKNLDLSELVSLETKLGPTKIFTFFETKIKFLTFSLNALVLWVYCISSWSFTGSASRDLIFVPILHKSWYSSSWYEIRIQKL